VPEHKRLGFRHWVTPRALLLHLAFVLIAAGCLTAAWWQVHRAMQGNTLSYLYSVEWPAFVVVAGIGWFQMVRDTPEDIEKRRRFRDQMRAASAEVVARTLPRSALAIEVESKQSGSRALGPGGERLALTDGTFDADRAAAVALRDEAVLLAPGVQDDLPVDEMTAYNRYLALLAVKGKAKTWRNPRGL
jgi:hypothetical protein